MVNLKEKLKESGLKLKDGLVKVGEGVASGAKSLGDSVKKAVKKEPNIAKDTEKENIEE